MKSLLYSLVFFLVIHTSVDLSAQAFVLDTNWGINMFEFGYNGTPGGMLIQNDGKAMIWGSISSPQFPSMSLGRFYLESGEYDYSFTYQAPTIRDVNKVADGYILNSTTLLGKINQFGIGDLSFF